MFCTKVWKIWVAVVIFGKVYGLWRHNENNLNNFFTISVIPVISQETDYDKFGFSENIDRIACKNSSAAVLEKQETLYQEFVKCVKNTVDIKQMNQDLRLILRSVIIAFKTNATLSDLYTSSLRLYSQRYVYKRGFTLTCSKKISFSFCFSYCPKLTTLINCEETYSSIYVDCYTPAEVQAKKIKRDTIHRAVDYFCENNAEKTINFITGKFVECVMPKQYEMRGCLKTLYATTQIVPDNVPLTTNTYCK